MFFHSWNVIHREMQIFFFDDTKTHLIAAEQASNIKLNKRMLSSFPLIFDSQHLTSINFYAFFSSFVFHFSSLASEIIERKYFSVSEAWTVCICLFDRIFLKDVTAFATACQDVSRRFVKNLLFFTLFIITHLHFSSFTIFQLQFHSIRSNFSLFIKKNAL